MQLAGALQESTDERVMLGASRLRIVSCGVIWQCFVCDQQGGCAKQPLGNFVTHYAAGYGACVYVAGLSGC